MGWLELKVLLAGDEGRILISSSSCTVVTPPLAPFSGALGWRAGELPTFGGRHDKVVSSRLRKQFSWINRNTVFASQESKGDTIKLEDIISIFIYAATYRENVTTGILISLCLFHYFSLPLSLHDQVCNSLWFRCSLLAETTRYNHLIVVDIIVLSS